MQRLKKSTKNDLLKQVPLFSDLKYRSLIKIAKYADEVTAKAGLILTHQGKRGYDFYFIIDGKAKVDRDGKIINTFRLTIFLERFRSLIMVFELLL